MWKEEHHVSICGKYFLSTPNKGALPKKKKFSESKNDLYIFIYSPSSNHISPGAKIVFVSSLQKQLNKLQQKSPSCTNPAVLREVKIPHTEGPQSPLRGMNTKVRAV